MRAVDEASFLADWLPSWNLTRIIFPTIVLAFFCIRIDHKLLISNDENKERIELQRRQNFEHKQVQTKFIL